MAINRALRGKAAERLAHANLMSLSADLPAPPAEFDATKQYRVKLKESVDLGNGHWLRPNADVVVGGAFANTIADKIIGAQVIG